MKLNRSRRTGRPTRVDDRFKVSHNAEHGAPRIIHERKKENSMLKSIKSAKLFAGAAAMAFSGMAAHTSQAQDFVAMLLPENVNPRWESQDAYFFVEAMKKAAPNATVEVFNANNDTATQQRQA